MDPEGEVRLALGRFDAGYILRFPGLADFRISPAGDRIDCRAARGVSTAELRHLLLNQVLPLVLSHQGEAVLHASAVSTDRGAVAFAGATGRGKSTLAAFFARHGAPAITDDCLVLGERGGGLGVHAGYPELRLDGPARDAFRSGQADASGSGAEEEKRGVTLGPGDFAAGPGPFPLRRIYLLDAPESTPPDGIAITRPTPREALLFLVAHAFKLDIADRRTLTREFALFGRLAATPLCRRLAFPRDLSHLPGVLDAVSRDLDETPPAA
jgi:hypothetical protein